MPDNAERPSDEDLMRKLRSATERAAADALFNEVFERYRGRVASWCYRITRSRDRASDLGQEVFLKAWLHRDSFRGDSRVSTWLYAITRNHCLTAMKKDRHDPVQLENALHNGLRDLGAVEPDRAAERGELSQRLLLLMARTLDPLEVRVMTLHYGHEIPLATITRELALDNPSGAKAYIVNARRKLHGVLRRRGFGIVMAARVTTTAAAADCWREEVAA
jgi:RNA polymerase sigma-70 factor, ECF subfamily